MGEHRDPVDETYRPAYHQIRDDEGLTQQEKTAAINALVADWNAASDAANKAAEERAPEIVAKALAAVKGAARGDEYKAYSSAHDSIKGNPDLTRPEVRTAVAALNERHRADGVLTKEETVPPDETLDQMRERVFGMKRGG